MRERWKVVPGYSWYEVSDKGRVRRACDNKWKTKRKGELISINQKTRKYLYAELYSENGTQHPEEFEDMVRRRTETRMRRYAEEVRQQNAPH